MSNIDGAIEAHNMLVLFHVRLAALRQISKACRDLRRNSNLDRSPDMLPFLEEIETQLEGLELGDED